jgi:hypothetical protein
VSWLTSNAAVPWITKPKTKTRSNIIPVFGGPRYAALPVNSGASGSGLLRVSVGDVSVPSVGASEPSVGASEPSVGVDGSNDVVAGISVGVPAGPVESPSSGGGPWEGSEFMTDSYFVGDCGGSRLDTSAGGTMMDDEAGGITTYGTTDELEGFSPQPGALVLFRSSTFMPVLVPSHWTCNDLQSGNVIFWF